MGFERHDDADRALERMYEAQRVGRIGDWEFDLADGSIYWSPQVFAILGRDPALGPPHNYAEQEEIYDAPSVAVLAEKVGLAVTLGEPQEYELVVKLPDGEFGHVYARAVPRKDQHGNVVSLFGTVQDISDRKRAERQVHESESRLGFALEAASIGDWDMDLRTNVAVRSLRHDQCFGYAEPVSEWGYDTFLAHVSPLDRDRVHACFSTAMGGEGEYDTEFRTEWSDGSLHWLWSKGRFYFDEAGQPYRVAGIQVDITERKLAEQAVRHLSAIVESSSDAIIGEAMDGTIISWNKGAEGLYGYAAYEAVGQSIRMLAHDPAINAEITHVMRRVALGDQVQGLDTVRRHKDGHLIDVSLAISPVYGVDGAMSGFSTIARDGSARKETERALQLQADLLAARLAKEAEASETLRELDRIKDDLVANVSHELRTPLTSISGYIELLKGSDAGPLTAQQRQWIDAVDRNSERLLVLVNNMLVVSVVEAGKLPSEMSSVDLKDVVLSARGVLQPLIDGRPLTTRFRLPANQILVHGDASQLERVVWNLVSNALKFTDAGGTVECALDIEAGQAKITVSDDGIGIPENEQSDLFTKFFRSTTATDRAIPGSGLGLSIAASIVRNHHGKISVISTPGRGTQVVVTLPLEARTPPRTERDQ